MRINSVFFKSVLAATVLLLPSLSIAQQRVISDVLPRVLETKVPYSPFDSTRFYKNGQTGGYIKNPNDTLFRLYNNVQLTKYSRSTDPEAGASLERKIALPNSDKVLINIDVGHGLGGEYTSMLCIATPDGTILSALLGAVMGGNIYIKQFRITDKHQVIITTIHALSEESIPLESFTSFEGYRQDVTYSVNEKGEFVKIKTQTFQPKTYTREYLGFDSHNRISLWKGGETLKE
jgi:hypothetical protein